MYATAKVQARSLCILVLLSCGLTVEAQDVGLAGPSYAGANSFPTGTKPQSKLWWNDGLWWGCLWSPAASSFTIHKLHPGSQQWINTGTAIDHRKNSHADCLWDGTKLYVASHRYLLGVGFNGHPLELYRFSYHPGSETYTADPGFPALIGNTSSEVLVIDKDSTGTLWAVWMRDLRVWVAHTMGDDRSWSTPMIHPRCTADVTSDDLCSVVRFQGNKIGVMWSDEVLDGYFFTYHVDGQPDTSWSAVEGALVGPDLGDDHINLKASADGRVFAALKTASDEIRLRIRGPGGVWSGTSVAGAPAGWTRPILLLDEEQRQVHVFGTSPLFVGSIYTKVGSMDAPSFPPGIGTAVIRDGDGPAHNDPTSTKQSVDGESGLVVLASHEADQRYWHHRDDLGGAEPGPPVASFSADPVSGFENLRVQFIDSSSGLPGSWSWTFGDGGSSTQQHPVHVYTNPGLYTVSLQVANGQGSDTLVRANLIDVDPAPAMLVVAALEDSYVRGEAPFSNFGAADIVRVRANPDYRTLLKFFVPPSANEITSATLRLFVTDGSPDGGSVHRIGSDWAETSVTWSTAPPVTGVPLGNLGPVTTGTWEELDVSSSITTSGTKGLGLRNTSSNSAFYSSHEGLAGAELVLTLAPRSAPPVAGFEVDRTEGGRPLRVHFFDTSSGAPTTWSWDFGDGQTSTQHEPVHVYTRGGQYDVTLTVSSPLGTDSVTRTGIVRVFPNLAPRFSGLDGVVALRSQGKIAQPSGGALELEIARVLSVAFPLPRPALGIVDRDAGEGWLELRFQGSLEELVELYEQELPVAGYTITGRTVHRDRGGVLGLTLFLGGTAPGTLELRSRSDGLTEATVLLAAPGAPR